MLSLQELARKFSLQKLFVLYFINARTSFLVKVVSVLAEMGIGRTNGPSP
jgi:hypothetical protein